jgi:hypothetical protein
MHRLCLALVLVLVFAPRAQAQLGVTDVATTTRSRLTAIVQEFLNEVQAQQHARLLRMAQRLRSLIRYVAPEAPRWRTHDWESDLFHFSRLYHAALNYGDAAGAAYRDITHQVLAAEADLNRLPAHARRALATRLATIEAADATIIAATHQSGQVRFNGRRELLAIEALERDVTRNSDEESATAVLGKISGARLIGVRQRGARGRLMTGVVEQLLIENKRTRDADAAAMNMQLVTWRDRRAANEALVAGSGDALRTWRQP